MIFIVFSCACLFVDKVDTKSVKTMKKAKNLLRSSLNRIRLEEEVYDLYRVQNCLFVDKVDTKVSKR